MITSFDDYENIFALALAILSERFLLPEQAFQKLDNPNIKNFKLSDSDKEDMLKLRDQGISYRGLSEIYGINKSYIYNSLKKYKGGVKSEEDYDKASNSY